MGEEKVKINEVLNDPSKKEKFVKVALESPRDFNRKMKKEVEGGLDLVDAFYERITESDFINLLMKNRSMEITENLYNDTGTLNPAFGLPKDTMNREDTVKHVYDKFDELLDKYDGLVETSFFNEFKKSIRSALRANTGGSREERRIDDINKILLGYFVTYENESKREVPKYEVIVGDDDNVGKEIERVTAKTSTPSSRYGDDESDLKELLSVEERPKFSEFFTFFSRMSNKPQMAEFKSEMFDTLFMTLDLGKARRRNEIYEYWQKYFDNTKSWDDFRDMFSKNGPVKKMIDMIEKIDEKDETKEIRRLLEDSLGLIKKDSKPVIRFKPIKFKSNPMFVKLNIVEQLFGYLIMDAKSLGVRFENVEVLDEIDNFDQSEWMERVKQKDRDDEDVEYTEEDLAEMEAERMQQEMTAEATYDKEGRKGADQGVYESVIVPNPELDKIERERKRLLDILESISDLKEEEVDPLFYYLTKNDVKFKNLGVTKTYAKMLEKSLKRKRRKMLSKKTIYDIKDSSLEKLDDIIDDMLEEAARKPMDYYYLPMTEKMKKLLKDITNVTFEEMSKKDKRFGKIFDEIKEFCDKLMKALKEGRALLQEGGSSIVQETSREGQQIGRTFAGQKQSKSPLLEIKGSTEEISDIYSDMLYSLYVNLVAPFESTYMPFDEDNPFFSQQEIKIIKEDMSSLRQKTGVVNNASDYIREAMADNRSILDYSSARGLVKFLTQITEVGVRDKGELVDAANDVYNAIADIFDDEFNDDNKVYLGKFLADISEKNDLGDITFKGQDVNDLAKEYKISEVYPIPALIKHIKSRKSEYERDASFDDDSGNNIISEKLLPLLEELSKKVRKSEIELAILHAHDMIRKKLNKRVYYSHGDIDDPEHVGIINKMVYDQYKIDLSASEIKKIDEEFGAFGEIAKENGVSEDIVYIIKSNFR